MDIVEMNRRMGKTGSGFLSESEIALMEAATRSMKNDLEAIGDGLEETLKEADAVVAEAEGQRREEEKIDEFAAEVASRHTR